MVTIYTTSFTFNSSTFFPHNVFMCFVWISEQTAIISLYNINCLVFIRESECVYSAVRTGCIYQVNSSLSTVTRKQTNTHGILKNALMTELFKSYEIWFWFDRTEGNSQSSTAPLVRRQYCCIMDMYRLIHFVFQTASYLPLYRRGPCSIPEQSMWDLWWARWRCDRFFPPSPSVLLFPCCSIPFYPSVC